jgi:SAM-dependent methyltransferase
MSVLTTAHRHPCLPWPVPALLTWLLAWTLWAASTALGLSSPMAFALATAVGLASAMVLPGRWRRSLVAIGFPLSALAVGAAVPAWSWLLALTPLLLLYPLRAWRDAPFFPTPAGALEGLDKVIELAPEARLLDAGCGVGHGLAALHRLWPLPTAQGIEWSRPLAWLAARRCHWAQVARGDMWAMPWSAFDLVYLFQRPESMARAWAKAQAEMAPGSWLVSLEFAVPHLAPTARLGGASRRSLWIYRIDLPDST